MTIMIILTH